MATDVQLRGVVLDDLAVFFEYQRDPEAVRLAAVPARDEDAFKAHWAGILADAGTTKRTILYGGEVSGFILCFERSGKREVGYWLGKAYWGKGIASQALAAFLPLVAERPLYAHVARHNPGSARVLEKSGFVVVDEEETFARMGEEVIAGYILVLA